MRSHIIQPDNVTEPHIFSPKAVAIKMVNNFIALKLSSITQCN